MNPVSIIALKRDGEELDDASIRAIVAGFVAGEVADYQMSAFAMAVLLRGMSTAETATLTAAMLESGERLAWPAGPPVVDKHSTGGIGDKVSLPLAPVLAALGARVPMISGRGLGPTGGTLDKLEAIPGFRTNLGLDEITDVTNHVGCVITGATAEIAPADRRLYALRDVTATVPSIPLITASILAKKLAAGLERLVLDVKFGRGAFMKTREDARSLAVSLVGTAHRMGTPTTALVTDMNQPLGRMVGNAVEVAESLDVLRGGGPDDVRELVVALAGEVHDGDAAATLDSGTAMAKFEEMVTAQGGDPHAELAIAPGHDIVAKRDGVATGIDAEALGWAVIAMGGGRRKVTDTIDHAVGLEMQVRVGETVERGQPLARVFARGSTEEVTAAVERAIEIGDDPPQPCPLVVERITAENVTE